MKRILFVFFSLAVALFPYAPKAIGAVNLPPVFSGSDYAAGEVGKALDFTLVYSDPDGDPVTLTMNLPSGAMYDESTQNFHWVPTIAGSYTAIFTASDGIENTVRVIQIDVVDANNPPIFSGDVETSTQVGDELEFTVIGSDPDGDALVITASLPIGATYDASSGLFQWMPDAEGTFVASFTADDGRSSTTRAVTITVLSPLLQNNLPIFSGDTSASTTVNTLLEFTLIASDPDGDPITLTTMLPSGATYATGTGRFSWTATSTGMFHAKFFASDGHGTSTHDVLIEVIAAPTPSPTPTPTPTPSGGGGGGGCCPGNGPPGLFNPPTPTPTPSPNPPTGGQPTPTPTSTPAINPVPLQPTPKLALLPRKEVLENISSIPIVTATSTPAEGRSVAAVLLAGLFNLFDWISAHWCDIGWLLWLLTLLAFILYIFLSREKEKEPKVGDSEAPEGMLTGERPAENNINEYWETYVPTELGTPQEKES